MSKKQYVKQVDANEPLTLVKYDKYLAPFEGDLRRRLGLAEETEARLLRDKKSLAEFADFHNYYGLHRSKDGNWVFREWAPNATQIFIVGDFNDWQEDSSYELKRLNDGGDWELLLSADALKHGDLYKLMMCWDGDKQLRIPAYVQRVVQDDDSKIFSAQVWEQGAYDWKHSNFKVKAGATYIYEAHIGMAQEFGGVGSYVQFRDDILPKIVKAGYNTIQLMAIQEHPYYGSFGYHVSNFFAASSRFGTPVELKSLIDTAHGFGVAVIMDIVHSHAVKNEAEGLSCFDGTSHQYFHAGERGEHEAWDSRCFNYSKDEVLGFLLSNCRFWLDEYLFDGFRFDGITSMLYHNHGLGKAFTCYNDYFCQNVDEESLVYLILANKLIHQIRPDALTVAEDMSGMPGLAAELSHGGIGFNYRLAMGVPDFWIKLIKEQRDEDWSVGDIFWELTNCRSDEKTISYAESHDQALVGDQTIIFRLIGDAMYSAMHIEDEDMRVERGVALHKIIRMMTLATAGHGYLNFMGNEFGHPEWIDFPREGNDWSYHYARRQWSLADDDGLRYGALRNFDEAMISVAERYGLHDSGPAEFVFSHKEDQVIGFKRAGLLFLFNFNHNKSFSDYGIELDPGKYELILDSDAEEFGGYGRIIGSEPYFTGCQYFDNEVSHWFQVYLPTRTVLVFEKID